MGIGVLSNTEIITLITDRKIIGSNVKSLDADELDESSLDLRLSTIYYSFKEGQSLSIRHAGVKVASLKDVCSLEENVIGEDGLTLKPREVYLFKLEEQLDLPAEISAKASGKSSIGRLDIMTRLLTDDSRQYDIVGAGYKGELFLEVISQIFPIVVRKGDSLNQLRFYRGPQVAPLVTRHNIKYFDDDFWYEYREDCFRGSKELLKSEDFSGPFYDPSLDPRYFDLRVELDQSFPIYRAKKKEDIDKANVTIDIRNGKQNQIPWETCWEQVKVSTKNNTQFVDLDEDNFYIMRSKERLYLPKDICVDALAISETLGDIRIHYAGFAHPTFGRKRKDDKKGTPLVFEVRSNNLARTRLFDGAVLAKILFLCMSGDVETKDQEDERFHNQELQLSTYFTKVP